MGHTHSDGRLLRDYLRTTPLTAARCGLYTWLDGELDGEHRTRLRDALAPLCTALNVDSPTSIGAATAQIRGKPAKPVMRSLTDPALTGLLAELADHWGHYDLAPLALKWTPSTPDTIALAPPDPAGAGTRRALAGELLTRVVELRAVLKARGGLRSGDGPVIDGRTLAAAAAAWQTPQITGSVPRGIPAGAARHANRVGRVSAAVGLARFPAALRSHAPDEWVVDPVLLLAAVAEAITPVSLDDRQDALRGAFPVRVRAGDPGEGALRPDRIWATLDAWGSPVRRFKGVLPLAWKLGPVEADALVWAVCAASARLAVASRFRDESPEVRGAPKVASWSEFRDGELPAWEDGVRRAWALVQLNRAPMDRTSWPGAVAADPSDESSWPWPELPDPWAAVPEPSGTVSEVPNVEVGE